MGQDPVAGPGSPDVWSTGYHARRLASEIARLMSLIADQREEQAELYRELARGARDTARRERYLARARQLDGLAARVRQIATMEHAVHALVPDPRKPGQHRDL